MYFTPVNSRFAFQFVKSSTKGMVLPRLSTNVTTFIIVSSLAQVSTAISRKSNVRH